MRALTLIPWLLSCPVITNAQQQPDTIRLALERRYAENTAAFLRRDLPAVMALRAPDFHTITPDRTVRDRAAMESYTQAS